MIGRPRARTVRRIVGGLLLAAGAAPAAAQVPDTTPEPTPPPPPATGGWAAYAAVPHPWSTVVALTAVLPTGGADDAEGLEGTAWLLGRTSAEAIRRRLGEGTVRVDTQVERGRTVYRILTVPGAWERAYRTLDAVLFGGPPSAFPELDDIRDPLLSVHTFEAGAPVREVDDELYRMLGGAGDPWSRDPRGREATLQRITSEDLAGFRRDHYDRAAAVLSLTGAVDPEDAQRLVTGGEAPADPAPGEPHVAVRIEPTVPDGPAWTEGDRIRRIRDVTSGWIAAAYPLEPGTPRTAVEMVVHRVRSELVTDPPAPGLFSAEVTLEDLPGGHVALLVRAAVLPESLDTWEDRIVDTMDRLADEPLEPGFFRFHRRQFRNRRLVRDADPEEEGIRTALDLRRTGAPRGLPSEIWQLDAEALHRAARGLGPGRILVFGPDLDG